MRQRLSFTGCVVAAMVLPALLAGLAHAAAPHCDAIKSHLSTVENIAIYSFGEERRTKLAEAQAKLLDEMKRANYVMPEEMTQLISSFENSTLIGHEKMRKGDARFLQKANEIKDKIRSQCP